MSGEDDSEKSHEPTQHKIDQARKKGDVAKSNDVSITASYGGLLIILMASGASTVSAFGALLMSFLDQAHLMAPLVFEGDPSAALSGFAFGIIRSTFPWFLVPSVFVWLSLAAQRAIIFAPSKLEIKLSRISLLENAKQKYGRRGLFEFLKSFVKLLGFSICLGAFLMLKIDILAGSINADPMQIAGTLASLCLEFLLYVVLVATVIAVVDYIWQRSEFTRQNMMSRKEIMDEMKDSEGDPHMKGERRRKAHQIASGQMMADVPGADVIIVNPTHYAVALKWDPKENGAPSCVAKGVDEIAKRIREIAMENAIPIHSDPPTARSLFATVEIGEEIQPEHYKAVAAAIRFSEAMRKKARIIS